MPCVPSTVASEAKSMEATMLLCIVKEGFRNWKPGWHFYTMDGAGSHIYPSMCRNFEHMNFSMYIGLHGVRTRV